MIDSVVPSLQNEEIKLTEKFSIAEDSQALTMPNGYLWVSRGSLCLLPILTLYRTHIVKQNIHGKH